MGAPYPVVDWFAEADSNHDGRISRDEFRADFEAFFRRLDTSRDGVVDGFETTDYERLIVPEILTDIDPSQLAGPAGGPGGPGARGPGAPRPAAAQPKLQGADAYSLLDLPEPVTAADEDFDSKITLKEFMAAADRRFDMLDPKGLGYLTLDTLPHTPAQIALEGRKPRP
jgi:hypothetical protein